MVTSTIAGFSILTKQWKHMGELKHARAGHGVYIQQDAFVVVGGTEYSTMDFKAGTERCIIKNGAFECELVGPDLYPYFNYPEMIRVPHDYCSKNKHK